MPVSYLGCPGPGEMMILSTSKTIIYSNGFRIQFSPYIYKMDKLRVIFLKGFKVIFFFTNIEVLIIAYTYKF